MTIPPYKVHYGIIYEEPAEMLVLFYYITNCAEVWNFAGTNINIRM